jgi:lipopolysaccharide biosynthesis glycosyltransferase
MKHFNTRNIMRYYVTYFDRNYLARGLTLINSLNENSKSPLQIFVHCLDELSRLILTKLSLPNVLVLNRSQLECYDPELTATMHNRDAREYLWTMTPTIILRTLELFTYIDVLTYLDADQYVFSDPEVIFQELNEKDGNCLIHEHRFSRGLEHMLKNGIYNVGVLVFRNNLEGHTILKWWRQRCLEWCYAEPHDGKMGDQGYLNDWPTRFNNVIVTSNIGIGVAPWNVNNYVINRHTNHQVLVNETPVTIFHFHGVKLIHPNLVLLIDNLDYLIPINAIRLCYLPYLKALYSAHLAIYTVIPDYQHGLSLQKQIATECAIMASGELKKALENASLMYYQLDDETEWFLFPGQQVIT